MELGFKTRFDTLQTPRFFSSCCTARNLSTAPSCPEAIVELQALYELTPAHISSLGSFTLRPSLPELLPQLATKHRSGCVLPGLRTFTGLLVSLVYIPSPLPPPGTLLFVLQDPAQISPLCESFSDHSPPARQLVVPCPGVPLSFVSTSVTQAILPSLLVWPPFGQASMFKNLLQEDSMCCQSSS